MSDRHKAPRRAVLSVTHVGSYGTTLWLHRLECGHVEKRKRKAPASAIGCSVCVDEQRTEAKSLVQMMKLPDEEFFTSSDVEVEDQAYRVAAEIASRLNISSGMVDVQISASSGNLRIMGASVWVPGDIAVSLLSGG